MEQRTNAEDWPARLIRPWLADREPYAAPDTPESIAARLGIRPETLIKLDQNENPYGCPEPVRQAIYESQKLNRYPDPEARECREAIAEYAGAPLSRIAVGNGADELIEVLSRLMIDQGDAIVSAVPSFGYYQTVAEMSGAVYRQVERGRNWLLPVDKLIDECQRGVKMLLIGSPNNPTGDTIGTSELLRLVDAPCLVVHRRGVFRVQQGNGTRHGSIEGKRRHPAQLQQVGRPGRIADRLRYISRMADTLLPDGASAVQRQRSGTDCGAGKPSAPGNFDGTGAIGDR